MSDIYKWQIVVSAPPQLNVVAKIVGTHFPTTVKVGDTVTGTVDVKNTGNRGGKIYYKVVQNPGESTEKILAQSNITVASGETTTLNINLGVFNTAGTYKFGIKVWGETEKEPPFTTGLHIPINVV